MAVKKLYAMDFQSLGIEVGRNRPNLSVSAIEPYLATALLIVHDSLLWVSILQWDESMVSMSLTLTLE